MAIDWQAIYGVGLIHFAYDTLFGSRELTEDGVWVTACGAVVVVHPSRRTWQSGELLSAQAVSHMPKDEFLARLAVQQMRLEAARCEGCFAALAPAV